MTREIILWLYFGILIILSFYGLHRYQLIYLFYKNKRRINITAPDQFEQLPKVTIQLPVFNEMYVVERLLSAVMKMRYPRELLQVQVLDDSTDETVEISQRKVNEYRAQGFNIELRHRLDRKGFKAGALSEAMPHVTGEFIAIFDADFLPEADFLEKSIHFFTDPQVAVVQGRWDHCNRSYSVMTEVQAILLDGHLMVEQTTRNISGRFFNFNGTAGVWRRAAIHDAGGWDHDTLTEDMDLSYRAQLKGWRFIFLPYLAVPAELPIEVTAFKSQQHRWAKGTVQVCKKLLWKILKSDVPFCVKLEAAIHLTSNFAYLLMLVFCILLLPAMIYRGEQGWMSILLIDVPLFMLATISVASFYSVSQIEIFGKHWWSKLKYLPLVTSFGIGLGINNTKAVLEALFNHKSGFVRTPKYNALTKQNQKQQKNRYKVRANFLPYIELAFGIYFTFAIYFAFTIQAYCAIPFLFLFQIGYLYMGILSLNLIRRPAKNEVIHIEDGKETFDYQAPKLAS